MLKRLAAAGAVTAAMGGVLLTASPALADEVEGKAAALAEVDEDALIYKHLDGDAAAQLAKAGDDLDF
ncbi:hypothetical protein DPM19_31500 [Actinomadura craniellae]|uniref:Peptidase n=1 Tax=Actinomadura craniellae TaxID=2231787 RepID=A0A365GWT8_9ACTN|nr:hypothetical protein [Actinomadura craniellae]RAY11276.1 hypothetical protein DPM19_31500 [Actinomadura craniellae]